MDKENLSLMLEELESWIKPKIPVKLLDFIVAIDVPEEDNILSGKTTIRKEDGVIKATITIFISKNVMQKPNIKQGIKLILIHEICHLVNLKNPDQAMKKYFPEEFSVWSKAQDAEALECEVKYHAS